jgi:hypothetical protein
MIRAFVRRDAISAAVSRTPSRMQRLDEDPTNCIVNTAHAVCCMGFLVIVAELWLACADFVQPFLY